MYIVFDGLEGKIIITGSFSNSVIFFVKHCNAIDEVSYS